MAMTASEIISVIRDAQVSRVLVRCHHPPSMQGILYDALPDIVRWKRPEGVLIRQSGQSIKVCSHSANVVGLRFGACYEDEV